MLCVDARLFTDLLLFGLCILTGKMLTVIFHASIALCVISNYTPWHTMQQMNEGSFKDINTPTDAAIFAPLMQASMSRT